MSINGVLNDQISIYGAGRPNMKKKLSVVGRELMSALSFDSNVTISAPLKTSLDSINMLVTFMNSLMNTIIFFLSMISGLLIYSLMISDTEEKTFEFAMLRALGFNTNNIMATIIYQVVLFVVPGMSAALIFSAFGNTAMRHLFYSITGNYSSYALSDGALAYGIVIGTIIPVLANIIPIQNALGKNLRSSLDVSHRKLDGLSISMKKLEDYNMDAQQVLFSACLTTLGVVTYYLCP